MRAGRAQQHRVAVPLRRGRARRACRPRRPRTACSAGRARRRPGRRAGPCRPRGRLDDPRRVERGQAGLRLEPGHLPQRPALRQRLADAVDEHLHAGRSSRLCASVSPSGQAMTRTCGTSRSRRTLTSAATRPLLPGRRRLRGRCAASPPPSRRARRARRASWEVRSWLLVATADLGTAFYQVGARRNRRCHDSGPRRCQTRTSYGDDEPQPGPSVHARGRDDLVLLHARDHAAQAEVVDRAGRLGRRRGCAAGRRASRGAPRRRTPAHSRRVARRGLRPSRPRPGRRQPQVVHELSAVARCMTRQRPPSANRSADERSGVGSSDGERFPLGGRAASASRPRAGAGSPARARPGGATAPRPRRLCTCKRPRLAQPLGTMRPGLPHLRAMLDQAGASRPAAGRLVNGPPSAPGARATCPPSAPSRARRTPPRAPRAARPAAARTRAPPPAATPSSRATRSITVPPSSAASRSDGGKSGRAPSRSRRAIAGRACAVWPENHCAAPAMSQAQRRCAQRRARRPRRRQRAVALGHDELDVQRRRASAGASRASPRRSRRARRAAAASSTCSALRPVQPAR